MMPVAIVLNGTSSAGKTSIARAIQRLSPDPVLHTGIDMFTDMFDWQSIVDAQIRRECHKTAVDNFNSSLADIASCPFMVVVDHVFEQKTWLEACRNSLATRPTYFVAVRCPVDILEARELARGDRKIGLARSQIVRVHTHLTYDFEVDTSVATPEKCAGDILSFVTASHGASADPT